MADRFFDFWRVDVFTDTPLTGNPLAVFPRATGLSDAEMAGIAREMNLSETTFVLPSRTPSAHYRNRIFTPGGEIPFAGHPSLGPAYVAAMERVVPLREGVQTVRQELQVGVLPLDLHVRGGVIERVVMTQATPRVGRPIKDIRPITRALGVRDRDLTATKLLPRVVSTGAPSLQIPLRSLDVVRTLSPDPRALQKVLSRVHRDAGAYVFTFETEGDTDLHARGFFPRRGFVEVPAAGGAGGACGASLAAVGRLPEKEWFSIEQGIEMNHPSRIEVSVTVERRRPVKVRVGGNVIPGVRGTLTLPGAKRT